MLSPRTRRQPLSVGKLPALSALRFLLALLRAAAREITWALPLGEAERRGWRRRAATIPDAALRSAALLVLDQKVGQSAGAGLFSTVPQRRHRSLLRFLVAYQTIWDFLDTVHEAHPTLTNGRQLHLALIEAVTPNSTLSDYYAHHTSRDDGGFLGILVRLCQASCESIPAFSAVSEHVQLEASRARHVLPLNHLEDITTRDSALQAWAEREFPHAPGLEWFELTGASSAGLAIFGLLALACEPPVHLHDITAALDCYGLWGSAVVCMLDSYADQRTDMESNAHSYIRHYHTSEHAVNRLRFLIAKHRAAISRLKRPQQHRIIAGCMTAYYLTNTDVLRNADSQILARAGGALTRRLLPVLRLWRHVFRNTDH